MIAGEPLKLKIPIQRMLELERAEHIVQAMAHRKLEGLTDAELDEVVAMAEEDAPFFVRDTLTLDGWRRDHNRRWVPPDIHAIDDNPVRGEGEHPLPRPAPGAGSGTPRSSSTAVQKLAELTLIEFRAECEAIRNDELRERWKNDREDWIHRWDRRADWIERWGGRQLP